MSGSKKVNTTITCTEAQTIGTKANLTGGQLKSVMADLRVKFGRNVEEKDLRDDISDHNRRFSEYFKVETRIFEDKNNFPIEKLSFYFHMIAEFLILVAHLRGQEWDGLEPLVQGDSGQLWFKLAFGLINKEEITEVGNEVESNRKKRRTREEGIEGGAMFYS